jgi:N6-L-threonylcarbamoyladenine synthase
MSEAYESEFGKTTFVYAGGVMCNSIIKKMLSEKFDSVFAEPALSADNAVGIAELARRAFLKEGKG